MSGAALLRRLIQVPVVLLSIYVTTVLLLMATPGNPFEAGERPLPPEVLAAKRHQFNYDQPPLQRYFWTWPVERLLIRRDLRSHWYEDRTVTEILAVSLPVSLQLGLFALCIALLGGTTLGVLAAANRGRPADYAANLVALLGISLPSFVVGLALLIIGCLWLRAVPVGGWGRLSQIWLPGLSLALGPLAYITRLTRSAMLEVMAEPYIQAATAKGVGRRRLLFGHAFPNAFLPVLSYLGPAAASVLLGSFVVEKVFAVPGVGTHVVESVRNRDQTLILATVLTYGALLTLFQLAVDLLYAVVDPRIQVGRDAR